MADLRLKHIATDTDRHGNVRHYVRLPGRKKIRLRGLPGSDEFMDAYRAAIDAAPDSTAEADATRAGSFRHLCVRYFASTQYKALDSSTRNWQRRALERICVEHGPKPVSRMEARHVRRIRNGLAATPAAANQALKALRAMFGWANEEEETAVNPTLGVKRLRYAKGGHHRWTPEEIKQFQTRHAVGTKARLAFDLLRYTTGRREDAVRFGPQHTKDGRVRYRQAKNEDRNPVDIDIPLHAELARSIAATPCGHLTFLVTEFGKPFTANGFGNKFKDWCRQADLPHCSAHGLRKATAAELAENARTPHTIMAITGHRTLEEVERYTRSANLKRLSNEAFKGWK